MADSVLQNKKMASGPLRRAMRANGIFSGVSGLFFIAAAGPIARFIGVNSPAIIAAIGIGLVGFAAFLFWSTNAPQIDRRQAQTVIVMDLLWVVGSFVLIFTGWIPLTTAGKWAVGLIAEAVFWFAVWQAYALRRQEGSRNR